MTLTSPSDGCQSMPNLIARRDRSRRRSYPGSSLNNAGTIKCYSKLPIPDAACLLRHRIAWQTTVKLDCRDLFWVGGVVADVDRTLSRVESGGWYGRADRWGRSERTNSRHNSTRATIKINRGSFRPP